MTAVAEAVIRILADVSPLIKETARGAKSMSILTRASGGVAKGLNVMGDRALAVGKRMSIVSGVMVGAGAAALLFAKNMAASGDEIAKNARAAGVSTEYYQEMSYAIGQVTNLTGEEFSKSLEMLTRKLGEAKNGSKSAIAAFEKVGISEEDIASGAVSTESAFDAMIGTFNDIEDPAVRAAIATALLGRSGGALGGQLGGAEGAIAGLRDRAKELGIVMSQEALDASELFGDQMDDVGKGLTGLKIIIANELLPMFVNTLLPAINDKVIPALGGIVEKISDVVAWFANLPEPVQEAAAVFGTAFAVGGPILLGIGLVSKTLGALIAATGPIGLFIAAAALAYAAWQTWGDDIKAAIGPAIDFITTGFGKVKTAIGVALDWGITKFSEFLGWIDRVIKRIGELATAFDEWLTGSALGRENFENSGYGGMGGAMGGEFDVTGGSGGMYDGGGGGGPAGKEIGAALADGLRDGYVERMDQNLGAIGAANDGVIQKIKGDYQVQSPSKVMQEIGQFLGQGLALGISDTAEMVKASMTRTGAGAVTATNSVVSSVLDSLGQMFEGSKGIAMAQALVNAWTGATEALKLPWPQNLVAFGKVLATGMSAVKNIRSARPGSSGGGGASGGGAAAAAQAPNIYNVTYAIRGDSLKASSLNDIAQDLNKTLENGGKLNLRFVTS